MTAPATRRAMQGNKRSDTAPELALRSALHALGFRFRKDLRLTDVLGCPRPDIAFTRARVAVFIDGCYWHSCPNHGRRPNSNIDYWVPKLERNVQRDRANDEALLAAGWKVVRIWEHVPAPAAVEIVVEAITMSPAPPADASAVG